MSAFGAFRSFGTPSALKGLGPRPWFGMDFVRGYPYKPRVFRKKTRNLVNSKPLKIVNIEKPKKPTFTFENIISKGNKYPILTNPEYLGEYFENYLEKRLESNSFANPKNRKY